MALGFAVALGPRTTRAARGRRTCAVSARCPPQHARRGRCGQRGRTWRTRGGRDWSCSVKPIETADWEEDQYSCSNALINAALS